MAFPDCSGKRVKSKYTWAPARICAAGGSFRIHAHLDGEANGVITATKGLTVADLDYLFDRNANTIGALMLHLAATETYYR